ncbi:DUF2975 domain-containing protein [Desertivibrio insolitus]|uniref:DUF2975 domain-containing protein n=1 Tax=Herbiconiux sp. SYSU D00978 TaxID=2812562 RepID=UPI001A960F72|nr:DUF2975 domain-containing protein [Herbiconiux sp. SYSU D00978]
MTRPAVVALRAVIILLGLGVLVGQALLVPALGTALAEGVFAEQRTSAPPLPLALVGIALGLCIEVALVAAWVLLGMVSRDAIFSERAFRWVDVIIGAGAAATLVLLALDVYWYLVLEPRLDAPGIILVLSAGVALGVTFVLFMAVMRGLLRAATTMRGELAEVV